MHIWQQWLFLIRCISRCISFSLKDPTPVEMYLSVILNHYSPILSLWSHSVTSISFHLSPVKDGKLDSSAWRPQCALYSCQHIHLQQTHLVHTLFSHVFHSPLALVLISIFERLLLLLFFDKRQNLIMITIKFGLHNFDTSAHQFNLKPH